MKPDNYQADIAIVGGGVAGCTAAIALAHSYTVVLIDQLPEPVERVGECLPPASRRILRKLNMLEGLEHPASGAGKGTHLTNIGTRSYWGSERPAVVDHLSNPDGFGWHLDRQAFETYLRNTVSQRGITHLWGTKLHQSSYENFRWCLTLKAAGSPLPTPTSITSAKFVIDASGRQSAFARQLGIKRIITDKLISCWATLPDYEENKMSTISSVASGWWYSAPLPKQRRVIAFQTDTDLIDRETIRNPSRFTDLARLNPEMAAILKKHQGEITFYGAVAANTTRLNTVAGQQWAAAGDAAMSFDPLSSQGMFNAMAGGLQLAELILNSALIDRFSQEKMTRLQLDYQHQTDQIWEYYLKHKHTFYRQEQRWKNNIFWERRAKNAAHL